MVGHPYNQQLNESRQCDGWLKDAFLFPAILFVTNVTAVRWSGRWWFPSDAYQAVQVGLASLACLLFVLSVQRWVHEPWFRIPLDGVHERRSSFPHSLSLHPNFLPNTNSKCPSSNSVFREMLPSNGLQTLWSNPIKNRSRWVICLLYIICQAIVSIAVSGCHRTEMQEMYMVVLKRWLFLLISYNTSAVLFVFR